MFAWAVPGEVKAFRVAEKDDAWPGAAAPRQRPDAAD
jgi:hypothetical protein